MNLSEIKELIHKSTLFSDSEKSEWLGLVESMNSKQLSDLVDILQIKPEENMEISQNKEIPDSLVETPPVFKEDKLEPEYVPGPTERILLQEKELNLSNPVKIENSQVPGNGEGASLKSIISKLSFFKPGASKLPVNGSFSEQSEKVESNAKPEKFLVKKPDSVQNLVPTTVSHEVLQSYTGKQIEAPKSAPLPRPQQTPERSMSPFPQSFVQSSSVSARVPITEITLPQIPRPGQEVKGSVLWNVKSGGANAAVKQSALVGENNAFKNSEDALRVFSINGVADVEKINLDLFRRVGPDKITEILQKIVRGSNYFDVLFAFEKSALYQAYVFMGKKLLEIGLPYDQVAEKVKEDGMEPLSKQEFEAVVDIQRQIRVN